MIIFHLTIIIGFIGVVSIFISIIFSVVIIVSIIVIVIVIIGIIIVLLAPLSGSVSGLGSCLWIRLSVDQTGEEQDDQEWQR